MRFITLAASAALTIVTPFAASAAPQRVAPQIRIPGKMVRVITPPPRIDLGPAPRPLTTKELVQVFADLAEPSTPATPQAKLKFSAMHMAGPGYALFRNADTLGSGPKAPADGVVSLPNGKNAEAWFFVPNATKPYLMDCSMTFGFATGAPTRLNYAVSSDESAAVTNGHVLFVIPPTVGPDGYTPVKVWSDATWFLFSCEATLMG